jgi:hypothetical protein
MRGLRLDPPRAEKPSRDGEAAIPGGAYGQRQRNLVKLSLARFLRTDVGQL